MTSNMQHLTWVKNRADHTQASRAEQSPLLCRKVASSSCRIRTRRMRRTSTRGSSTFATSSSCKAGRYRSNGRRSRACSSSDCMQGAPLTSGERACDGAPPFQQFQRELRHTNTGRVEEEDEATAPCHWHWPMAVEATEVRCGGEVRAALASNHEMLMSCASPSPLAC